MKSIRRNSNTPAAEGEGGPPTQFLALENGQEICCEALPESTAVGRPDV